MIIDFIRMDWEKKFRKRYASGKQIASPKINSKRKLERGGCAPRMKTQVKDKKAPNAIQVFIFCMRAIVIDLLMIQNGVYIARTIYCGN